MTAALQQAQQSVLLVSAVIGVQLCIGVPAAEWTDLSALIATGLGETRGTAWRAQFSCWSWSGELPWSWCWSSSSWPCAQYALTLHDVQAYVVFGAVSMPGVPVSGRPVRCLALTFDGLVLYGQLLYEWPAWAHKRSPCMKD